MSKFSNWSGSVKFQPQTIEKPRNEEELKTLIKTCAQTNTPVRVVGTGHSFTPLIETKGCLISLDHLQGIQNIEENGNATLWGGTKLWHMNELLFQKGRSLENLGDIDRQSIAGTVSTGTHGTGKAFGSVSTQIQEMTLIKADGSALICSPTDQPEIFKAAQVSLGSLGVISRVKLKTLPAYKLKLIQEKETLDVCLAGVNERAEKNRHFEFYYFPYTQAIQSKFVNQTDEEPIKKGVATLFNDIVLENAVFKILSEISRWVPGMTRPIARFCGFAVGGAKKIDWAHRIFSMPRYVKFQEMEFSVPAASMAEVLRELAEMIEKKKMRTHFPIECRFVKGDDIWLSPANGRDSAYLAVHSYKGMEHRPYFEACQSIFRNHQGRPHWGKLHFMTAKELRPLYPQWDRFQEVRKTLDPQGIFMNEALKRLFLEEK